MEQVLVAQGTSQEILFSMKVLKMSWQSCIRRKQHCFLLLALWLMTLPFSRWLKHFQAATYSQIQEIMPP